MLFLPECFGFLGSSSEQTLQASEKTGTTRNPAQVTEVLIQMVVRESAATETNRKPMEDRSPRPLLELSEGDDHNLSLLDGIRTIAVASNLWISAGSIHVAVAATEDEPPRVYNTHVIVDATGAVRAEYRKIHLFDVCIPGKVDLRESKTTKAGTELVVCPDSPIGKY